MMPMSVPEPVMSLAVMPKARDSVANFSKALNRFQKEDPTFKVRLSSPAAQFGSSLTAGGFAFVKNFQLAPSILSTKTGRSRDSSS